MTLKRLAAAASTAVVLALSLSACGDDAGGAPDDAKAEDFCKAYNSESEVGEDASAEEQADEAHKQAEEMIEVGTPEDIDEDAREGFEFLVDAIADIDEDDVEKFSSAEGEDDFKDAIGASDDDYKKVTAFLEYATTTCQEVPAE